MEVAESPEKELRRQYLMKLVKYSAPLGGSKIKSGLGWRQKYDFENALRRTVRRFLENMEWVENVRSGEYIKDGSRGIADRGDESVC